MSDFDDGGDFGGDDFANGGFDDSDFDVGPNSVSDFDSDSDSDSGFDGGTERDPYTVADFGSDVVSDDDINSVEADNANADSDSDFGTGNNSNSDSDPKAGADDNLTVAHKIEPCREIEDRTDDGVARSVGGEIASSGDGPVSEGSTHGDMGLESQESSDFPETVEEGSREGKDEKDDYGVDEGVAGDGGEENTASREEGPESEGASSGKTSPAGQENSDSKEFTDDSAGEDEDVKRENTSTTAASQKEVSADKPDEDPTTAKKMVLEEGANDEDEEKQPDVETREAYLVARQVLQDMNKSGVADCRRHSSEAAALTVAGDKAVSLDAVRANYPVFDISSPTELTSVKTHWNAQCEPNEKSYIKDFEYMLDGKTNSNRGYREGLNPVEQSAEELIAARDEPEKVIPVPDELVRANRREIVDYIRDKSVLRIPEDHLAVVRAALVEKIVDNPGRFYMEDKTKHEIEAIVQQRVKGAGIKATEMQELIDQKRNSSKDTQ